MPCGLSNDALDVLNHLVWKRAVSEKSSRAYNALRRDLPDSLNLDAALQELGTAGLIGSKKKDRVNYWAALGPAQRILSLHGYKVARGGRIRL